MTEGKLFIKEILSNWHILSASTNVEVIDIIIPIEQALQRVSGELTDSDIMILDCYTRGYTYEEIAKIAKVSRQTASSRIKSISRRIEAMI
jgi:DNA-directed RNA polymerase specialized sigma24 family protein